MKLSVAATPTRKDPNRRITPQQHPHTATLAKLSDVSPQEPSSTAPQRALEIPKNQGAKRLYPSISGPLASLEEDPNTMSNKRMSYLAPTQEENSSPSNQEEIPLSMEELTSMVLDLKRSKEKDSQLIRELKAQLEGKQNNTRQPSVKSTPNTPKTEPREYPEETRQTLVALSPYPIIKRLSGKINSPDKLTDGVTPKAKHWLISMVNKLTINDDYFETESAKMAFIWGCTDGLAQSILEPGYTSTDSNRFHTSQDMLDTL